MFFLCDGIQFKAGRGGAFPLSVPIRQKKMRALSKVLWLLAFLAATFCWMVLFEHGFSLKAFSEGVRVEFRELLTRVTGGKHSPPAAPEPPAEETPPPGA